MSKRLSKIRLYTQNDFKNAPKLDRILMAEMEPDKFCLSHLEAKYLEDLRTAYALVGEEISEAVAIKRIRVEISGYEQYVSASKLLQDMQQYWRNFIQKNKEYKQGIVTLRMYRLAEKAQEIATTVEELEIVSRMLERAARLEGLDKVTDLGINPKDIQIGDVLISSDPSVFIAETAQLEEDDDE